MTVSEEKAALRRWAASLPKMEAASLLERFAGLPQVTGARTVLLFYGVGSEPDTLPLLRRLWAEGRRAALPVCLPGRQMEARLFCGEDRLIAGPYGIPQPDPGCPAIPREEVDAVLVPHLLCDREGYRLGHGGGYYDRWLAGCSGFTAAVCPEERLVDRLPRDGYDLPVHLVLTPTGDVGRMS